MVAKFNFNFYIQAYAKICGNYENLEGGYTSDAVVDLTGGIEETFLLDPKNVEQNKTDLWKIICKSRAKKSMEAVYIEPNPHVYEERLPNGLIRVNIYLYLLGSLKKLNKKLHLLS